MIQTNISNQLIGETHECDLTIVWERSCVGTELEASGGRRTMYLRLLMLPVRGLTIMAGSIGTKSHERVYEPRPATHPAPQRNKLMSQGVYGDRKN
jgi:hypothetical protein